MKKVGEIRLGDSLYIKTWVYEALERLREGEPPLPPTPDPSEGERALESASVSTNSARKIARWAVTADLEYVTVTWNRIVFPYQRAGWPIWYDASDTDKETPLVGNLWFMARIEGDWYASTVDWLRPHQKDKTLDVPEEHSDTAHALPTFCKVGVLGTYVPQAGAECGMFVSSIARNSNTTVNERSQVVLFRWSY